MHLIAPMTYTIYRYEVYDFWFNNFWENRPKSMARIICKYCAILRDDPNIENYIGMFRALLPYRLDLLRNKHLAMIITDKLSYFCDLKSWLSSYDFELLQLFTAGDNEDVVTREFRKNGDTAMVKFFRTLFFSDERAKASTHVKNIWRSHAMISLKYFTPRSQPDVYFLRRFVREF